MQTKRKWSDDEKVTEAGLESFPASDPPAHNMPGRAADGAGADRLQRESEPRGRKAASVAIAVGAIVLVALVIWLLFR